ncbi:hypothetical protein [Dactylosporangium sp. NPDC005555]|uniref:hypothetical protein n=1 Tax=Dactylosporangium sp. NPDC005555 TaxID=3154889 RepID=UPI0033B1BDEA
MSDADVLVLDADPPVAPDAFTTAPMIAGALTRAEAPMNLVPALLLERLGTPVLVVCGQQLPVPDLVGRHPELRGYLGRQIVVGFPPEHLQDAVVGLPRAAGPSVLVLHGIVRLVRHDGRDRIVHLELADTDQLSPPTMVARVSPLSAAGAGEPIMLAVDSRHLVVFDTDDGRRLW